jgi:hypothetical protein
MLRSITGRIFLIIIILLFSVKGSAQDMFIPDGGHENVSFETVPVKVLLKGFNNFYLDVVYGSNNKLYINFSELMNILEIPCKSEPEIEGYSGFFNTESNRYAINYKSKKIINVGNTYDAQDVLLMESGIIYIESSFMSNFGLPMRFDFKTMTLFLEPSYELPAIKRQRLENQRKNILRLQGENIADTILTRSYHLFRPGTADWAVSSNQTTKGSVDNQFRLGLGAELLYGDADLSINYNDRFKFDNRQIRYRWKWVDNDNKYIRQAQAGRINDRTIAFLNAPLVGALISNSPMTVRKTLGSYNVSDRTEPGWIVELYINNLLTAVTKADETGLFSFKVPVVYGNTSLKLKYYGPQGEERTEEKILNVPFNFTPKGEIDYTISGGILQDGQSTTFGKGRLSYGITPFFTVGTGMEYLSSISTGKYIPFISTSIQPFRRLILDLQYAHGVNTSFTADYNIVKNIFLDLTYIINREGQKATLYNYLEERNVKLTIPIKNKIFSGFSKISFSEFVYKNFNYNNTNLYFSGYYRQFTAGFSSQLNWTRGIESYNITELFMAYRFRNGFAIKPSARYSFSENKPVTIRMDLEKSFLGSFVTLSAEKNLMYNDFLFNINIRYDFKFARTAYSVSQRRGYTTFSESAQGSFAFGTGSGKPVISKNSSVGKGGILIYPFLDLNQNGTYDKDEKLVKVRSVRFQSGTIDLSSKDTVIRISGLNAFRYYTAEFRDNDLGNISWRFSKKTYSILVDPEQYKRVFIPVIPVGEVNGMIYLNDTELNGEGRIMLEFLNAKDSVKVGETMSDPDGYFSYVGLKAGDYLMKINSDQLKKLGYNPDSAFRKFTVIPKEDGDIIEGKDFILYEKSLNENGNSVFQTTKIGALIEHEGTQSDTRLDTKSSTKDQAAVTQMTYVNTDSLNGKVENAGLFLQVGAFRNKALAERLLEKLSSLTGQKVEIIREDGFHKVRISGFVDKEDIGRMVPEFRNAGVDDFWIVPSEVIKYHNINSIEKLPDININIKEEPGIRPAPSIGEPTICIRVAVFDSRLKAEYVRKRISLKLEQPAEVLDRYDQFWIIIPGFYKPQETFRFYPELAGMGYPGVSLFDKKSLK